MTFKEAAGVCRRSYVTIWRLARVRRQLTYYKRLGLLRVVNWEVEGELQRNLIVCPGGERPEVYLEPGSWLTIAEAATELGLSYDHVRRHKKEFTRTSFFGKALLYKNDLRNGLHSQKDLSIALKNREKVSEGLGIRG